MSDLMTIEEVSNALRVSVSTLRYWRLRGQGEGPLSFRVGTRVMYARVDVNAYIARLRADAADALAANKASA